MVEIRLAPRQQIFVQALLKGATYVQAYRKAKFPGSDGLSDQVARSNASNLIKRDANIRQAMSEAREELRERTMLEACDLVTMLLETRELAMRTTPPQTSAAVAAVMGIGKILGIAIDRSEAHLILHKPAPLPTSLVELSSEDWKRQFDPQHKPRIVNDFLDE